MTELEQVAALCQRLGAEPVQAATMAAQLLKRADQLARERGLDRVAAMSYLLRLMMDGRNGETPPEFPATRPPGA
ncbi:MAG TPA: hypothetical protein VG710_11480 [Opitutus sp.]|nr:hypothetical protein [Opitutus sp.]